MEGTPFWIITTEEKGTFLVLGKHQLTEGFINKNKLLQHVRKNAWEITLKMMLCVYNDITEKQINKQ